MDIFTVYVSRRFWPWPKRYKCKGIVWGLYHDQPRADNPEEMETVLLNKDVVFLVLANERRVYVPLRDRIITLGRDVFEMELRKMEQEAGQKIPMA